MNKFGIKTGDESVLHFCNVLDDIDIKFKPEQSVKVTKDGIIYDRMLIWFESDKISLDWIYEKAELLDYPYTNDINAFNGFIGSKNTAFSIEKTKNNSIEYRIYFEYDLKYLLSKNLIDYSIKDIVKIPSLIGYKWEKNNANIRITDYSIVKFRNSQLLLDIFGTNFFIPSFAKKIIERHHNIIDFYIVNDRGGNRISYDIGFKKITPTIDDLSADIDELFGINIKSKLRNFTMNMLGHISCGNDKNGDPFITFYFYL